MTDHFSLVGLEARPGWDAEKFDAAYRRLAAAWHPDAVGGDPVKFRQLQEARAVLGDPAARLRHLIALRGEAAPSGWRPDADDFLRVGGVIQSGQALKKRAREARSAIGRAAVRSEVAGWLRAADDADAFLRRDRDGCEAALGGLDQRWPEVSAGELADLAARFTFLGRWADELRELRFALTAELGS